jgi:predicted nucleotidyltransferase
MKRLDEAELPDDVRAEIARMVATILQECDPELVILFGSQARGDAHLRSDFDLVVVADVEDIYTLAGRLMRLLWTEAHEVDVLVVSPEYWEHWKQVRGLVLYRANRDGVILHGQPA